MRNDSFLNTGMTSSSTEPKTPREKQVKAKEEARLKLKPAADVVLELLAKEKSKLYDIRYMFFDEATPEDEIRIEKMLRVRHEALINLLETKLKNILADKPKKGKS